MNKELIDDLVKVLQQAFSDTGLQDDPDTNESFSRLASYNCGVLTIQKGQPFIQMGFPANTIWVLLSGSSQVICYNRQGTCCVQDAPTRTQIFGLMEQLNHQSNYTATVCASSDCRLIRIPSVLFMEALDVSIPLLRLALEDLCELAKRAMNLSEFHTLYDPKDNLVIFLNKYCSQAQDYPCVVHTTRKEMAEILHMNLRSLYRYLDVLKQDGLFSISHGKITISEEQGTLLHEYCQGL